MDRRIEPGMLSGRMEAIASKSELHRLILCAALADAPVTLLFRSGAKDVEATLDCASALGAKIERRGDGVRITPISCREKSLETPVFYCRESGSTLRFVLPLAAALGRGGRFYGEGRLAERPLGELVTALERGGIEFSAPKLPFEITGRLRPGRYTLPGNVSSQYVTGLLMALPLLEGESEIGLETALESASYVDITLAVLRKFGVDVRSTQQGYTVPAPQCFRSPGTLRADGDWSNGAFFLAAGALGGAGVTVTGLRENSTQGDRVMLELLRRFGAAVESDETGGITVRGGTLHGIEADLSDAPDLLPVLAVLAACAEGMTRFTGAARLRLKESDRLVSTAALVNGLGGCAEETTDGLLIRGGKLLGGTVSSYHDHRIAMAAAVASVRCLGDVCIRDAGAVEKSYPGFFEDFAKMGGKSHVV